MAAIAWTQNSAEIVKDTPSLNSGLRTYLKPNESEGRMRIRRFTFFPVAAVAAGQVIALGLIPKGCRIQEIKVQSNGTVATSTLNVGAAAADGSGVIDPAGPTSDSATLFATGLTIATAGAYNAASTIAQNYGYEAQVDIMVIGTLVTAGIAGTGDGISGHITYVKD